MEKTEIEIEDLVEIKLFEAEDFLKIKETLTRIGVSSRKDNIANLLEDWELLEIVNQDQTEEPVASIAQIKIISHKQKGDWELCPKYHIGNKH